MRRVLSIILLASVLTFSWTGTATATKGDPPGRGSLGTTLGNAGVGGSASDGIWQQTQNTQAPRDKVHTAAYVETFEYRSTLNCGNYTNPDASLDTTGCGIGLTFCVTAAQPDAQYLNLWFRVRDTDPTDNIIPPWQFMGSVCSSQPLPAGAPPPPPVPSMAQIRQAFADLPFGRPTVAIQPVGGKTLVNLPTFYEVKWDGSGLEPGQISPAVQLLSWSVEFEVGLESYEISFGDGDTSGKTTDVGGPFPSGSIRHTYTQPIAAAEVTAQTHLIGRFRVNGGAWMDLSGTADLQNEPVTTLEVAEAHAQLVTR